MAQYEKYLQNLGIPFHWYVGKQIKQIEYRDLTGPEKVKLIPNMNISTLLPDCSNRGKIQKIWDDFWDIMQDLKKDFQSEDVKCFKAKVTRWLRILQCLSSKRCNSLYARPLRTCARVFKFVSKSRIFYTARYGKVQ